MNRAGRAALLLALAWPLPPARADDAALSKQVDALVADLGEPDPAVRGKAAAELGGLGSGAVPFLIRRIPKDTRSPRWAGVLDALAAIDLEGAIAEIECTRSQWRSRGWLAKPEGSDETLVRSIVANLQGRRARAPGSSATLAESELEDPFAVPPWIEQPVGAESLPEGLAGGKYAVRERSGSLEIDAQGLGRVIVTVAPRKPEVVEVGPRRPFRKLLVYRRNGTWFAAPAATWTAQVCGVSAEFLDADFDGRPGEVVRFAGGAFQRSFERLGWSPAGLFAWQVVPPAAGAARPSFSVAWSMQPEPAWRSDPQALMIDRLNAWRQQVGLTPQRIDRARSEACGLHHAYWEANGFSSHDEVEGKRAFSPEGALAGNSSSVLRSGSGAEFVSRIAWTVLHRVSCVGRPDEGAGAFSGGFGSLLWGGDVDASRLGFPILVPGPGMRGVPLVNERETPEPDNVAQYDARPHGAPVSVTWSGLGGRFRDLREISLSVFPDKAEQPLPGVVFSHEFPYAASYTNRYPQESAIFVADHALARGTRYLARFSATGREGPVAFGWEFRTGE